MGLRGLAGGGEGGAVADGRNRSGVPLRKEIEEANSALRSVIQRAGAPESFFDRLAAARAAGASASEAAGSNVRGRRVADAAEADDEAVERVSLPEYSLHQIRKDDLESALSLAPVVPWFHPVLPAALGRRGSAAAASAAPPSSAPPLEGSSAPARADPADLHEQVMLLDPAARVAGRLLVSAQAMDRVGPETVRRAVREYAAQSSAFMASSSRPGTAHSRPILPGLPPPSLFDRSARTSLNEVVAATGWTAERGFPLGPAPDTSRSARATSPFRSPSPTASAPSSPGRAPTLPRRPGTAPAGRRGGVVTGSAGHSDGSDGHERKAGTADGAHVMEGVGGVTVEAGDVVDDAEGEEATAADAEAERHVSEAEERQLLEAEERARVERAEDEFAIRRNAVLAAHTRTVRRARDAVHRAALMQRLRLAEERRDAHEEAKLERATWVLARPERTREHLETQRRQRLWLEFIAFAVHVDGWVSAWRAETARRQEEVRRDKAARKLTAWARRCLEALHERRIQDARAKIQWHLNSYAVRWKHRRRVQAAKTLLWFAHESKLVTKQKLLLLQYRDYVRAASNVARRWHGFLVLRQAQETALERAWDLAESAIAAEIAQELLHAPDLGSAGGRRAGRRRSSVSMAAAAAAAAAAASNVPGAAGGAGAGSSAPGPATVRSGRRGSVSRGRSGSVVDLSATLPRVPIEVKRERIRADLRYRRWEHQDAMWQHARKMKALEPFFAHQRRALELVQRMRHRGPASTFVFDDSVVQKPPSPSGFRAVLSKHEIRKLVLRTREEMQELFPSIQGWCLQGDASWSAAAVRVGKTTSP